MSKQAWLKIASLLLLLPGAAMAHTGTGDTIGFWHGLSHPIGGMDHLLAMAAVGLWAIQMGGRALWVIPTTFVVLMVAGGVSGFSGVHLPLIEEGILASVLIFGALIAGAFKFPLICSSLIVGFFAVFHGYAHGIEMPIALGATSYSIGFALATALLHGAGIAFGAFLQKINYGNINRLAGGAIALSGIYLAV